MKVRDLIPAAKSGGGRMVQIATFDLQVTDDIAFYGMRLLRDSTGNYITYAATALGGRRSATFARPLAEAITAAALKSYTEQVTADGPTSRA